MDDSGATNAELIALTRAGIKNLLLTANYAPGKPVYEITRAVADLTEVLGLLERGNY